MGTSVHSLHIAVGSERSITQDAVDAALKTLMEQRGFHEIATRSDAHRIYYVVAHQAHPWIGIFNERPMHLWVDRAHLDFYTELDQLAPALSASLDAALLSIEVHDSDVVKIQLYENGSLVDTFSNWVNYEQVPKRRSGAAEKWQSTLPATVTVEALAQAWQPDRADYPFEAEGALLRIARLLHLDEEAVVSDGRDFAYLDTDDTPDAPAGSDSGAFDPLVTIFYFQKR